MILAIDLAERYSAAILMGEDGGVLLESTVDVGSRLTDEHWETRPAELERWWGQLRVQILDIEETVGESDIWIEDIHPFAVNPGPAFRLGGALLMLLNQDRRWATFVKPSRWQRDLGYKKVKNRSSKGWAKEKCAELGYVATSAGKGNVDLRDAFLIAAWVRTLDAEERRR